MSSTAIETRAVSTPSQVLLSSIRPGSWQVEIWKLSHQFMPIAIFSVLGVALVQVIAEIMSQTSVRLSDRIEAHTAMYVAPLFAALVFGIGVVCQTCGIERENRTWHWRTELPGAWQFDLLARFSFLILGATICWTLTFVSAWTLDVFSAADELNGDQWLQIWEQCENTLMVSFPSLAMLAVFCLLVDSVGLGVAMGTLAAFLIQGFLFVVGEILAVRIQQWWLYSNLLATPLMMATAVWVYRWRWTVGLNWQLTTRAKAQQEHVAVSLRSASTIRRSLGWQSLRQISLPLILLTSLVVGKGIWAVAQSSPFASNWFVLEPLTLILAALIGMEIFGGDRKADQVHFLSDRGVTAWAFWSSRVVVGAGLTLAILLLGFLFEIYPRQSMFWPSLMRLGFATGLLFLFLLSRICFKGWIVSIGIASIWSVLGCVFLEFQYSAAGAVGTTASLAGMVLLSLAFSYLSTRVWMRDHAPGLIRYSVAFSLCFVLFNLLAHPVLRVMSVPRAKVTTEQLFAEAENAKSVLKRWDSAISLELNTPSQRNLALAMALMPNGLETAEAFEHNRTAIENNLLRPYATKQHTDSLRTDELTEPRKPILRQMLEQNYVAQFQDLKRELSILPEQTQELNRPNRVFQLHNTLDWLASFFVIAASAGEDELAKEVLDTLYRTAARFQDDLSLYWARSGEWKITLSTLPDADWKRLLSKYEFEELVPPRYSIDQLQKLSAVIHYLQLADLLQKDPFGPNKFPVELSNAYTRFNSKSGDESTLASILRSMIGSDRYDSLTAEDWRMQQMILLSYENSQEALQHLDSFQTTGVHPDFWTSTQDHYEHYSFGYNRSFFFKVEDVLLQHNVGSWIFGISHAERATTAIEDRLTRLHAQLENR